MKEEKEEITLIAEKNISEAEAEKMNIEEEDMKKEETEADPEIEEEASHELLFRLF